MTTTQTTSNALAPAWARPGQQVAFVSGYGQGSSYSLRTVVRHTKTTIIVAHSTGREEAFKLRGTMWTEVGGSKFYEDTIHDPKGDYIQRLDRAATLQEARNTVQNEAQVFANKNRRWTTIADAEQLQEALGRFITTMTALGETE